MRWGHVPGICPRGMRRTLVPGTRGGNLLKGQFPYVRDVHVHAVY